MEIESNPRTFSLLLTEQELTAVTQAVVSWIDNSTGEDPAGTAETLWDMYQQLRDALEEEEVVEIPEAVEEEVVEIPEAVEEEVVEIPEPVEVPAEAVVEGRSGAAQRSS
jgi:hypothetical protein